MLVKASPSELGSTFLCMEGEAEGREIGHEDRYLFVLLVLA